jgi:hypothetical protein
MIPTEISQDQVRQNAKDYLRAGNIVSSVTPISPP